MIRLWTAFEDINYNLKPYLGEVFVGFANPSKSIVCFSFTKSVQFMNIVLYGGLVTVVEYTVHKDEYSRMKIKR